MDSIKIKMYRDDEKIKEEVLDTDSDDDCSDNSLNMTYDYGKEEDDES